MVGLFKPAIPNVDEFVPYPGWVGLRPGRL
jgi:hypothetical protein